MGKTSKASETIKLPSPTFNISQLQQSPLQSLTNLAQLPEANAILVLDQFLVLKAVPFPKDVPRLKEIGVGGFITLNESYETLVPTSLYSVDGDSIEKVLWHQPKGMAKEAARTNKTTEPFLLHQIGTRLNSILNGKASYICIANGNRFLICK
ncbi:hypothetical protein Tco_0810554, partial [Tanacetum coccineum]